MNTTDRSQSYDGEFMVSSPCVKCGGSGWEQVQRFPWDNTFIDKKPSFYECKECRGTGRHERYLCLNELYNVLAVGMKHHILKIMNDGLPDLIQKMQAEVIKQILES